MCALVPWPKIEPRTSEWETQSLSHWTNREILLVACFVPYNLYFLMFSPYIVPPLLLPLVTTSLFSVSVSWLPFCYLLHFSLFMCVFISPYSLLPFSFCLRDYVAVVQSLSCVQPSAIPWTAACQASLSFTVSFTHVHSVNLAIQQSHPLSPASPPAYELSQHQGLFQWVGSLNHVTKVLELQLQHQSFQWIFRTDFL